jgi:hypothetical protein
VKFTVFVHTDQFSTLSEESSRCFPVHTTLALVTWDSVCDVQSDEKFHLYSLVFSRLRSAFVTNLIAHRSHNLNSVKTPPVRPKTCLESYRSINFHQKERK